MKTKRKYERRVVRHGKRRRIKTRSSTGCRRQIQVVTLIDEKQDLKKSKKNDESEECARDKGKRGFKDRCLDLMVRIWDGQFTSLVGSNVFVLIITLTIIATYTYISCVLESDSSKILLLIIDTIVPTGLTYYISIIIQNIVEVVKFKEGHLNWSFTAVLVAFTVIFAMIGVSFKFIQTFILSVVVGFSFFFNIILSIISQFQIQESENRVRLSKEAEKQ